MKIAVLIQDFPPETGAGPARITELSRTWIADGHTVSVLTGLPNRRMPGQTDGVVPARYRGKLLIREEYQGIKVLRSWVYASKNRSFAATLVNHLSFTVTALFAGIAALPRPDVLIASGPPYFSQFAGALIARWRKIPLVVEVRDLWPDYLKAMGVIRSRILLAAMFATERWLFKQATHIVVVTDAFRDRLIEKGVDGNRITVIPNGVDVSRYYSSAENPPVVALQRRAEGEIVAGYIGTFGAGQGLHSVIEAIDLLRSENLPVRLVLVGDGPERARIEAMVEDSRSHYVSVNPPIPRDLTRAFYNACDVVIIPHAGLSALADTIPSKIFEAMACERPIVAALAGEGARIVTSSEGGVLAHPGDGPSVALAISRVVQMTADERDRYGRNAREFVLRQYDRAKLANRYSSLLRHLSPRTEQHATTSG